MITISFRQQRLNIRVAIKTVEQIHIYIFGELQIRWENLDSYSGADSRFLVIYCFTHGQGGVDYITCWYQCPLTTEADIARLDIVFYIFCDPFQRLVFPVVQLFFQSHLCKAESVNGSVLSLSGILSRDTQSITSHPSVSLQWAQCMFA